MRNGGLWTDGRFKGFVTSSLRGAMRRWPPKWAALKAAYSGKKINKKSGRLAQHFKCASCGKDFLNTHIQIDHIIPIGKCETWDEFIEKLFCEQDNLQALCKTCHSKKSKNENIKTGISKRVAKE